MIIFVVHRFSQTYSDAEAFSFDSSGPYYVERVIDGDTFVLEGGVRVRLLGVNTPETKHPRRPVEPLGPEASEFTKSHIENRLITLRFDRERRDRYHRVLAYVYVGERFLNEEINPCWI
jgi:micrococcal nuclease